MADLHPLNEEYLTLNEGDFRKECASLTRGGHILRMMFATDEREIGESLAIYAVYSLAGTDKFRILRMLAGCNGKCAYQSISPLVPAAHWYEREIRDMFGIEPLEHPDPRPLVLHGIYPEGVYPLRRDVSEEDIRRKVNLQAEDNYKYMEVKGDGVYEIPVGPVHAGIIEPGHFRFSAVGETIYFLDPRLFFTHKGIEKRFEGLGFEKGVLLSERVSGVSSFTHSAAYCMAVERMAGIEIPDKASATRTILLELERIWNHIGDIGNLCAGTGFALGNQRGAILKEKLMRLNGRLTGSRFLRGVNTIGGINLDILDKGADDILFTLDEAIPEYKALMESLTSVVSHMERMENTGILSADIARKLGATGIAARASGINDDIRTVHKYLHYDRVVFEPHVRTRGDVLARMMVRADEVECSLSIIESMLKEPHKGALKADFSLGAVPSGASALGYAEGPRGSVFYFAKAGRDGKPLRVKVRSASFCNWPLMPFAVRGNIIPDFPLINKSFNLSYSGCDM